MRITAMNIKSNGNDTTDFEDVVEFDVSAVDFGNIDFVWAAARDAMFEFFGHMDVTCWKRTYGKGSAE